MFVVTKVLVFALTLTHVLGLAASEPGIAVRHKSWPASCPDRDAVAVQAREHLRGWPGEAVNSARVVTDIRRLNERWLVELEVRVESGVTRRAFEADSCGDAVDGIALIVASAVSPGGAAVESEPLVPLPIQRPAPTLEPDDELGDPTPRPRAPVKKPEEPRPPSGPSHAGSLGPESASSERVPRDAVPPLRLAASGHVGLAFGLLPRGGADLGGFIGAAGRNAELGAVAGAVTPRTLRNGDYGGRFTLAAAGVRACGRTAERLYVGGCGELRLGAVTVRGIGFDQDRRVRSLWSGAVASAWIGYRLGVMSVRLEPGLVVGLLRPTFVGGPDVFEQQLGRWGTRVNVVFFFEGR